MNAKIKTYLYNNWKTVKFDSNTSCYWWKEYINFNVFLYDSTFSNGIDIIDHDRGENIKPRRPTGHKHYFKKYEDWVNFDYKQFKLMLNDLDLYDKKLSIKKKLDTIKKDF